MVKTTKFKSLKKNYFILDFHYIIGEEKMPTPFDILILKNFYGRHIYQEKKFNIAYGMAVNIYSRQVPPIQVCRLRTIR